MNEIFSLETKSYTELGLVRGGYCPDTILCFANKLLIKLSNIDITLLCKFI